MKKFQNKWQKSRKEHKGKLVYPKTAQDEVRKLMKHIEKGCVSDIEPGKGTIRNEALHRKLNQRMNKNKISPTFAYALMFTIIHAINRHLASLYKRKFCDVESSEEFGLPSNNTQSHASPENDKLGDANNASEIQDELVNCKVRVFNLLKNYAASADPNLACDSGIDLLSKMMNDEQQNDHYDESNLDANLAALGLVRVPSKADGSCLFMSISYQLIQLLEDEDIGTKVCNHLSSLFPDIFNNIQPSTSSAINQENLAIRLRATMVDEWLNNEDKYKTYVPDINLQDEAPRFLLRDQFDGDLGDLMVQTLSNVLNMAILLVTPNQNTPIIPLFPSNVVDDRACIYLAFDSNLMHFDSTASSTLPSEPALSATPPTSQSLCTCSCGVNDKTHKKRCNDNIKSQNYKSRCPCAKQHQSCTSLCRCKGCTNHYGQRVVDNALQHSAKLKRAQRKRSKEWMDSKPMSGRNYMQQKGHILRFFSKKDDFHLKQSESPQSCEFLRKQFTVEHIKRRQQILTRRAENAKHAVGLSRKGM
ncbi:hypothetical protein Bbelb_211320 [Branchiostoma belcheri]|nr:hypothetical protein Bbelb_211320 [Branchiostoma belcheri]